MAVQPDDVEAGQRDGLSISRAAFTGVEQTRSDHATGEIVQAGAIPVLEERLRVSKRRVKTGSVKVSIGTETHEELAKLSLERGLVDVTHVPVDRVVDETPQVRIEGNTTIVPIFEERFVMMKQVVLVAELHIRQRVEHEATEIPVSLRRQHVVIEHLDADGHPIV